MESVSEARPASRRGPQAERLARVEERVDGIAASTNRMEARLNRIDLNGHGPAIRTLAEAAPALVQLAAAAPVLVAIASERQDDGAALRSIRRRLRWDHGVGATVKLIIAGLLGATTWQIVNHLTTATTVIHH